MNKVVGLVGAISGLATLDGAQAAGLESPNTTGLTPAKSYAELLEAIPNALAVLRAVDAAEAARTVQEAGTDAGVTLVQYHHHHHHRVRHHHHHNRWWRRHHHHHHHRWRRHHHHHHHHSQYLGQPTLDA
ncbi:MAG TPA: hypothetical protein VGX95_14620 [Xanthobacteraceae bacterium]|jgi:hypothetical protein|nr:hypothetical protein [Xanthobacteraceae bacterium]